MSNLKSYERRVAVALAEHATAKKINGLSSWDPSDFTVASEKFVEYLDGAQMNADFLKLHDAKAYRADALLMLRWDIDEAATPDALDVALFEVGPDLTGIDFELA